VAKIRKYILKMIRKNRFHNPCRALTSITLRIIVAAASRKEAATLHLTYSGFPNLTQAQRKPELKAHKLWQTSI
jgi:hypothetical protein